LKGELMTFDHLKLPPFNLGADDLAWVKTTFETLSLDQKLGQIMLPLARDLSSEALDALLAFEVGGVHRMISRGAEPLRASAEYLQSRSLIPLLMPADIEFSEKGSVGDGTPFPNQMTVAATGDPEHARRMGVIAGREGGYCGFNATWTPVVDLALNFRSNVVNTRSFGSDAQTVLAMAAAYLDGIRSTGMAATVKHWLGDGLDDRDQHFATTHNSLDLNSWQGTFGAIYRDLITQGIPMIMAGHITLPAYTASLGDEAHSPAHMPATLNADLTLRLLREELGFNGVIVSDATMMNGFNSRGERKDLVPLCIESSCDILLFPRDIAEDLAHLKAGVTSGALSRRRVNEAVIRILGLKAAMGLHRSTALPDVSQRDELLGSDEHRRWAQEAAAAAVTLVKDTQNLLPLSPVKHPRIVLAQLEERMSPSGPLPPLQITRLLEEVGFAVTLYRPGDPVDATQYDLALYVMAEEGVSGKEFLGPHWEELHGLFPRSMERLWHKLPTAYISLGSPFLLFHMPECKTYVNACSAILPVQEAAVQALTGQKPFQGRSPVDAFCGLAEAQW
jgi:beta-N-acetylhexosaminidase